MFLFSEVKKNHYEILGITKTAGNEEIKRAYFTQVRKYQPDRFPEEFKEIRTAYEILSDGQKRAEYDIIGNLPQSVAPLFHEAQEQDYFGRHTRAAELYQMILKKHPELDAVRERYAQSLSENDKNGKASEVWQELCRRHPDNPRYARELGKAYLERGWNKKAVAETRRALGLDRSSLEAWALLVSCTGVGTKNKPAMQAEMKSVCQEALEAIKIIKTGEWEKMYIYTYAFILTCLKEKDKAREYLREIIRITREGGRKGQEEGLHAIQEIVRIIPGDVLANFYPELREGAALFSKADEDSLLQEIDEIKLDFDIERLGEKGFPDVFYDLFVLLTCDPDFESDEDEIELTVMEFIIIENKSTYDSYLRRLRTEFPDLYDLHGSFFNEVLRTRDPDKMMYQRAKKLKKLKHETSIPDEDPDSGTEEPVRRTQPKVGRNDPCPCGSGKKYKKCCGR